MNMEFACTKLAPERIVRCAFGFTRLEFELFTYLCAHQNSFTSADLESKFSINRASAQRALKKMHEQELCTRHQVNFSEGGYEYRYELVSRTKLRSLLKSRLSEWVHLVEKDVLSWSQKKFS